MKLVSIITFFTSVIFAFSTRFHFTTAVGFTVDLIHRDFIRSPSLVSSTISSRLLDALRRSFNRVNVLTQDNSPKIASADIFSDKGEYLMKFSIGTPPVETLAVADTGSDLTWIQCKPCSDCFHQKTPLFEPKHSSTYKPISCTSTACDAFVGRTSCDALAGTCRYKTGYGDMSFSNGYLATETITLGSVVIPDVIVGCGNKNRGTFSVGASGIVGLGGGKVSLITQMSSLTKGKFSYCLGSYISGSLYPSKMKFGDNAVVSGDDVTMTAIVAKSPQTYYFLTLVGISVGNHRIEFYSPSTSNGSKEHGEGNIIIDTGTTLTFLTEELYIQVRAAIKEQVKSREIKDPEGLMNLCYAWRSVIKVPKIIFHFKGADVELKPENSFVKTRKNCLCLGFAPTSSVAIYGNLAQMDFLVGYDLEKSTVSFKPKDCSKA